MKIKIKFDGIEPVLSIQSINMTGGIDTKEIGLFYPFRRLVIGWYNFKTYNNFKKLGYPTIKCEGCGGGYAEWKIKEPNGENCFIKCCKHCVSFYDRYNSKKRLEAEWLLDTYKLGDEN